MTAPLGPDPETGLPEMPITDIPHRLAFLAGWLQEDESFIDDEDTDVKAARLGAAEDLMRYGAMLVQILDKLSHDHTRAPRAAVLPDGWEPAVSGSGVVRDTMKRLCVNIEPRGTLAVAVAHPRYGTITADIPLSVIDYLRQTGERR